MGICLLQHARQSRHILPWSEAGQVFVFVDTALVHGHQLAFLPSTIWPESLIIKLAGIMSGSMSFKNFASRVGSQWLVSGVRLHTSKICLRCHALCRSPLSCHLNHGSPCISVTIASTQRGCLRLAACIFRSLAPGPRPQDPEAWPRH